MALQLRHVVYNYSSTVRSAKDSYRPRVEGVPMGVPGPSQRRLGLCGCVIMPVPLVSICASCCLLSSVRWEHQAQKRKGRKREGGAAAFHRAGLYRYCLARYKLISFYIPPASTDPPPHSNLRLNFN